MDEIGNRVPYDFFVSYARKDDENGWITAFVEALIERHKSIASGHELKPFFDKKSVDSGSDWEHTLHAGIAHSNLFLAFVSHNYIASEWCRKEWMAWLDHEISIHIFTEGIQKVLIVPVPIEGTGIDGPMPEAKFVQEVVKLLQVKDESEFQKHALPFLRSIRRRQSLPDFCELFAQNGLNALREESLKTALDGLAKQISRQTERIAAGAKSESTVPAYNKNFTGRLEELRRLREWLTDDRTQVIYGISGLGGIGKSELSFTYAHAFAFAYPGGRFIIRCERHTSLKEAVLSESGFLAYLASGISEEERMQPERHWAAVQRELHRRIATVGSVLLVLDNVSDLNLLSKAQTEELTAIGGQLHLLATTRILPPGNRGDSWLKLGRLSREESLAFLEKFQRFADEAEEAAALRIVERLDGFALALEVVAASAAVHVEKYSEIADRLGLALLDRLGSERDVETYRHNDEQRLSAVLMPVLEELSPIARRVMEFAAFLPPDVIALPWLRQLIAAEFPEVDDRTNKDHDPWKEVVRELERRMLIAREVEGDARIVRVHRMVQEVTLSPMPVDAVERDMNAVVQLAAERLTELNAETKWQTAKWELEPLEAFAWQCEASGHPLAAVLLGLTSNHLYDVGEWSRSELLIRRALEMDEARYGKDHPEVATDLNNLAQLLKATNRLAEAEPLMQKALEIDEATFGKDHFKVAIRLSNLAALLYRTNRLTEAESLMRRTLAIDERSYGKDHPKVATDLNNLAQLLSATNRLAEAEPLMRRTLAIDERGYGKDHPEVATDLNNLASLLYNLNRLAEAEPLMRRALQVDEASFGKDHPKVAIRLSNLAQLFQATNRLAEAEPLIRRALKIDETSYGKDHPSVAIRLNNLALLFQATNRLDEAETLMRRALQIDEYSYGKDHPDVAIDLNNLASLLQNTDRLNEAEPLMRRAYKIFEASYSKNHPSTRTILGNLAAILLSSGRDAEAQAILLKLMNE